MQELNASDVFERLGAPFTDNEIEWRIQQVFAYDQPKALVVPYIQSRAIMNRLDEVVGWDRWENLIQETDGGFLEGIRIHLSSNRSVTKWDGADRTNFEPTKGGISSAFKRAAVHFNIGRYLYSESAKWVEIKENRRAQNDVYVNDKKTGVKGYFTPPTLSTHNRYAKNPDRTQHHQSQNRTKSNKENEIPQGMLECSFQGLLEKKSSIGPYLEVWFEKNGKLAHMLATGEMREYILSLNLEKGDSVAIATEKDSNDNSIITSVVKVSKAAA